jgi:hypothetical protein
VPESAWRPRLHPRVRLRRLAGLGKLAPFSFITDRPAEEPGFTLERQEADGRSVRNTTRAYTADKPAGERY